MEHIENLDRSGLRKFGLSTGAIVAALFAVLLPWLFDRSFPLWPWLVALPLWALALAAPNALRPVYVWWMRIGAVLGAVNARIILGLIFFVMFTPIAVLLRLLGKDAMNRRLSRSGIYKIACQEKSPKHMEKPF
jgi:hypothetical protein